MSFYRFIVHGEGIRMADGAIGFFTTRDGVATDQKTATNQVLALLTEDWRSGVSADFSPRHPPKLCVLKAWLVADGRHQMGSGHSFYTADNDAAEKALKIEMSAAFDNTLEPLEED